MMEESVKFKIKVLLEHFTVSQIVNNKKHIKDQYFHKLSRLIGKPATVELPVFTEWLMTAVPLWTLNKITPDVNIAVFTLNLASAIAKNETKFVELNKINNFYKNLIEILGARNMEAPYTVKLAYMKLVSSFLEHKSGIEFTVCNDFWEDILHFSLKADILVSSESWTLVSKILERTFACNSDFCDKVVKEMLLPLEENIFKTMIDSDDISDEIIQDIIPTLQLVVNTLEYFLESALFFQKDLRVPLIFMKNFRLKQSFKNFITLCENRRLNIDLGKLMFIMQFLELYIHTANKRLNTSEIELSLYKIMDIFNETLKRGTFDDVLKFSCFGFLYWQLIGHKINHIEQAVHFSNQLLLVQVLPFLALRKYLYVQEDYDGDDWYLALKDDFRDAFRSKMFKMADHDTVRIGYVWQRMMQSDPHIYRLAKKSLDCMLQSRKYYRKECAIVILQLLIYKIEDIVTTLKQLPGKLAAFLTAEEFIGLMFEGIMTFQEEFEISWKDCAEVMNLMLLAVNFLTVGEWPTVLTDKALTLMNFAFTSLSCPNLAFLVDTTSDCSLDLVGPLVLQYSQHEEAELRNSALEVICTMSKLSSSKFPSLQKVLMDSDLPGLVVKMATQDGESFVRATAIKCLQEMIQVEEIWNNALQSQDLSEKMRQILINETEGIVRVEAATFMCISYENNHFPDDSLEKVYETMIHSSTTDLHWEVKVRALSFWDKVIHNHLQHQGMIDGSFPSVTFSKEHRKIVTLTDAEIKKRLQKILGQLSCIGCLGVLISAIRDDCDMEVSKTAVKITQKLVELLKKYSINADSTVPISPQPTENGMSSSASISSGISGDDFMGSPATNANTELNEEIIDQIVNSRDVNLLQNVYTPSDYGSVLNYDVQVRKIVSPNEFLLFTQQDLNAIINEKKNWLNGIEDLGSLLDDMLKTYDDDVNSMDCY